MYSGTVTEGTTFEIATMQNHQNCESSSFDPLLKKQMQNHNLIFLVGKIVFDNLPGGDIGCCY